jgi:hypothetical protein
MFLTCRRYVCVWGGGGGGRHPVSRRQIRRGTSGSLSSMAVILHLLCIRKMKHEKMKNLLDIVSSWTTDLATNNDDPYTAMKDVIFLSTSKPKWSSYFDLFPLLSPPPGNTKHSILFKRGIFLYFLCTLFYCTLLHLLPLGFHCSEDAGIEPTTVATLALTARRSNPLARSHPQLA